MKIGIIGAGNIGGTLARRQTALGHDVTVANSRGPQSLKALTDETGAKASTVEGAARDGDVVVIAVPLTAVPSLPSDAFRNKVVVDADNYYPTGTATSPRSPRTASPPANGPQPSCPVPELSKPSTPTSPRIYSTVAARRGTRAG